MFCCLYIFAFFMQGVPAVLVDLESNHFNRPAMPKDYDYIYDFLQSNITLEDSINSTYQTKAYNVIRIIWEDSYTFPNIMYMQALHKARKYLLSLENLETHHNDSGLQLAIALSYFLESHTMQYEKIKFHMQQWVNLGREIPKNLVKMTDYKDSIQTIELLCSGVSVCNYKILP